MTPEREKEIKAEYGYQTSPRMCSLCRFVQTATDVILSGGASTVSYCTLPEPEGRFVVYERACCDRFQHYTSTAQAGPAPEEFF